MKKYLLCIGLCLTIIIALFMGLAKFSSHIYKNDIIYSLVVDVAQFARENDNRFPDSWFEFVAWNTRKGVTRWKPDFLNIHFQLRWGIKVEDTPKYDHIFIINDGDIKCSEKGADDLLRREIRPKP